MNDLQSRGNAAVEVEIEAGKDGKGNAAHQVEADLQVKEAFRNINLLLLSFLRVHDLVVFF